MMLPSWIAVANFETSTSTPEPQERKNFTRNMQRMPLAAMMVMASGCVDSVDSDGFDLLRNDHPNLSFIIWGREKNHPPKKTGPK